MGAQKIFNVKTIKDRSYNTLDLGDRFNALLGKPEAKFVATLYGKSGSGKSVFALQLANEFSHKYGKVLYNSHEEGVSQTIQDRINHFGINAPQLYFGNKLSFNEMVEKIKANYYKLVFIDSAQYMDFTYEQLKQLRELFRRRHLSIVIISFGSAWGKTRGADDLLFASDIKAYFDNGHLKVQSRYLGDIQTTVLFRPGKGTNQTELSLL